MKDQPRIVFTNNAGYLIPKNGLREEKVKVKASNNVYCAMEYNKLSYRPWNYNTNVCIIVPCIDEKAMVILIKPIIINNIQIKLYGYMNMNILHSSMSQLKNLFQHGLLRFIIFYNLYFIKRISKLRYLKVKICSNLVIIKLIKSFLKKTISFNVCSYLIKNYHWCCNIKYTIAT